MAGIFDLVSRGLKGTGILGGGEGAGNEARLGGDDVGRGFAGGLFNRPGASEALIAFGANMLAAPSFGQGMGAGATAFLDTLRTEEDRRRPKNQFLADGAIQASTDPMTGEVTFAGVQPVQEWQTGLANQKLEGQQALLDARGDQRMEQILTQGMMSNERAAMQQSAAMERAQMAQAAAMDRTMMAAMLRPPGAPRETAFDKKKAEVDAKAYGAAYNSYNQNLANLGLFDNLMKQAGSAGVGAGAGMQAKRLIAQTLGMDLNGVDIGSKGFSEAMLAQLELGAAQGQKGLGQLTEAERSIIRKSIPAMDKDPRAFRQVIGLMDKAARMENMTFEAYQSRAQNDPNVSFTDYTARYKSNLMKSLAKRQGARGTAAVSKSPARITSDAQYNSLPSGSTYISPDGKVRKKP